MKKKSLSFLFLVGLSQDLNQFQLIEIKSWKSKKVIEIGGERIRGGYAVLVFPEGTRKKPEEGIGKFGNSCGLLASNEAVPIIPICHNSGKYWINRSF